MNVTDYAPFLGTIGGGFPAGALAGYTIKQVIRIAAVIVGLFIAALAYLEYQKIINVDWVRGESFSQNGILWIGFLNAFFERYWRAPHTADFGFSNIIPLTSSLSDGILGFSN
jgi:uncharacterized membrane protein (Fun14 family)